MILYYERVQNKETALIFKITIVSFMFIPLGLLIQLVGRVGMYFAPATIIAYPIILKNLRKPVSKTIFLALLLIFTFYSFFQFFYSATYMDDFGIYQTILSSPQWY
jgi:O-antigen ligase